MCTEHHSSLWKHCQTNCLSADTVITQLNKAFSSKTWQEWDEEKFNFSSFSRLDSLYQQHFNMDKKIMFIVFVAQI